MKKLGEILFRTIMSVLASLPLRVHYWLCGILAFIMEHIFRYRRKVVELNLARSFPEKDRRELRHIRHGFYVHFGEIIAETIKLGSLRAGSPVIAGLVSLENTEVLDEVWAQASSVLLMASHTGNWELSSCILECGTPVPFTPAEVCEVYKKLSSPMWERFMSGNRTAPLRGTAFDKIIESRNIMRFALNNRDKKLLYLFPNDQYPYRNAARCDVGLFMNQPTLAMTGAAQLASKLHMAVVYMNMRRDRKGHYTYVFDKICDDASTMEAVDIMKEFCARLEKDIKECPSNYLWSHRRWKQNKTE